MSHIADMAAEGWVIFELTGFKVWSAVIQVQFTYISFLHTRTGTRSTNEHGNVDNSQVELLGSQVSHIADMAEEGW